MLQKRCMECHRSGEAAPMPLVAYKDARPWAKAIREAVKIRRMPPWHADPNHGSFSNDRSLSKQEIETLAQWADTGAAEGSPMDAPPPVQFAQGWTIGVPDAVIQMPKPFPVPAQGTVEYTYFIVPTGLTEDKCPTSRTTNRDRQTARPLPIQACSKAPMPLSSKWWVSMSLEDLPTRPGRGRHG